MLTRCAHTYIVLLLLITALLSNSLQAHGLPLYYWQQPNFVNFGDYISLEIVQRMVGGPVSLYKYKKGVTERRLLAVGSLLFNAKDDDVIWGSGTNGKRATKKDYTFTRLDVRAVRGPLTRDFLMQDYQISCPEIYGDPALLFPYLFPEFQRSPDPKYDFIIIPIYYEAKLFPKELFPNAVYPTDPWHEVISKILDSKFVVSTSLHGIIIAEAYGIPARYLRLSEKEPLLKYKDYYLATQRPDFQFAASVDEALLMGGEPPCQLDLEPLYNAFPFEFWPETTVKKPDFNQSQH